MGVLKHWAQDGLHKHLVKVTSFEYAIGTSSGILSMVSISS